MKNVFGFFSGILFLLTAVPAFACHPDRHFGTVVAIDERAERFAVIHLGSHPDMGGKYFVFSADGALLRKLKLGSSVAIAFVEEEKQLIATETEAFDVS